MYTVKKARRDAEPKHEGDGKFHHPSRTIGKTRQHQRLGLSIYCIWVTEFSVTLALWSCVTLGFSNSVTCKNFRMMLSQIHSHPVHDDSGSSKLMRLLEAPAPQIQIRKYSIQMPTCFRANFQLCP
jgi:hypothetical protein